MPDRDVRERILDALRVNGPISEPSGRATHVLKDAVGYEKNPLAFSRILASMDSDGLLVRDVRGKRTYEIALGEKGADRVAALAAAGTNGVGTNGAADSAGAGPSRDGTAGNGGLRDGAVRDGAVRDGAVRDGAVRDGVVRDARAQNGPSAGGVAASPSGSPEPGAPSQDLDYDELAFNILRRVADTLAARPAASDASSGFLQRRLRTAESRVSDLEKQLARARAEAKYLQEERDELTARLEAAENNLTALTAQIQQRRGGGIPMSARNRLDPEERAVLRRLAGG